MLLPASRCLPLFYLATILVTTRLILFKCTVRPPTFTNSKAKKVTDNSLSDSTPLYNQPTWCFHQCIWEVLSFLTFFCSVTIKLSWKCYHMGIICSFHICIRVTWVCCRPWSLILGCRVNLSHVLLDARAVSVAVVLKTESHCVSLALNSFHRGSHSPCFVVHHAHLSCVCVL